MDVEVVKSDMAQLSMESGIEENGIVHQGIGLSEPIKFGSHGVDEPVSVEGISPVANFLKDAVDEWPEPKQIHSFYFVKYRSYEDPKLKAILEHAENELQKKNQARSQIFEKLRAKKSDKAEVNAQIRPLRSENDQYWTIMGEKRKEMEPLQQALGKLRNTNSVNREKGVGLCSSEDELNYVIKSLHYRIQHESIPLSEEKQLLREIKQLEGTREKVIANDAMRAKIQDSLGEKDVIQDQVKLMGVNLDGVRKDQQAVKTKLKQLVEERDVIEKEITKLDAELTAATDRRGQAYNNLQELKKKREEGNSCYYKSRALLNNARELAAKKDIEALKKYADMEVEKFMSLWNSSKAIRDDYERRLLPSLDIRQLSRDGRMRNPDEKPLVVQEARKSYENETVTKANVKRPTKENSISPVDVPLVEKVPKEAKNKPQKDARSNKPISSSGTPLESIELEDKGEFSVSEKLQKDLQPEPNVVDEVKLKETKREEEIAKAKLALERKKKLAEKAAAKAAMKAQKEAEKKLKDREKKAKKKAASGPASKSEDQPTELSPDITELEKVDENVEAPVPTKNKDWKESTFKRSNRSKAPDSLPRVVLKRKKSTNYWVWAVAPAAVLSVAMLLVVGYKYFL